MRVHHGRRRRLFALGATVVATASLVAGVSGLGRASAAGPDLSSVQLALTPVATGLSDPVALAWRQGDPRMYVAEKTGTVRIVAVDGTVAPTPVLTVAVAQTDDEQGLLGLTFSPDGTKLYVDYTDLNGDINVVEYTMAGDVADPATSRVLLLIPHPNFPNHNGGEVIFGPDGDLYIGVGDGGSAGDPNGNAQNTDVLLGKILRINPAPSGSLPYTIPADNPFAGQAGKRGEIWMYGLRNPWRFSFDRTTGEMWIGDVGQDLYEEVDVAAAGQNGTNFGWNQREGFHPYNGGLKPPGAQDPLFEEPHTNGYCALVGGYVYRGSAIANLNGAYIFGDDCRANLVGVAAKRRRRHRPTRPRPQRQRAVHLRRRPQRRALLRQPPRNRLQAGRRYAADDLHHRRADVDDNDGRTHHDNDRRDHDHHRLDTPPRSKPRRRPSNRPRPPQRPPWNPPRPPRPAWNPRPRPRRPPRRPPPRRPPPRQRRPQQPRRCRARPRPPP